MCLNSMSLKAYHFAWILHISLTARKGAKTSYNNNKKIISIKNQRCNTGFKKLPHSFFQERPLVKVPSGSELPRGLQRLPFDKLLTICSGYLRAVPNAEALNC